MWRRLISLVGAVTCAAVLTACPPAARPENPAEPGGERITDINAEVARIAAAADPAAGRAEALVLANVALVALNLNQPDLVPGVQEGQTPDRPGTATPHEQHGEPVHPAPGNTVSDQGTTPAPGIGGVDLGPGGELRPLPSREGGGLATGPVVPGGLPSTTGPGGPATSPQSGLATGGVPIASSEENVQNNVATAIQERFPFITQVRFTRTPEQASRLAALAADARNGRPVTDSLPELGRLAQEMVAAANLTPMPGGPPGSGRGEVIDTPGDNEEGAGGYVPETGGRPGGTSP